MKKCTVFRSCADWIDFKQNNKINSLGFIPTMGALHAGHLSLVEKSKKQNEKTLVSIFINPTQFNDSKDFEKYPKTIENDLKQIEDAEVDFVLIPEASEIYKDNYRYRVNENDKSKDLCGKFRPGHFDGVLTVVMKLLNIADANFAYFGEKDYQQYLLIKEMSEAFFMKTKILSAPTIRESSGLAMSSRNVLLSEDARKKAAVIYQLLKSKLNTDEAKEVLISNGFDVDYFEEKDGRKYAAVKLENVRLIDNV